jgi:hypothetical protein
VAATGGLFAPAIGGMIGAAVGLSGAAGTAAGLAALGAGTIYADMAVVTTFMNGGGAVLGVAHGVASTPIFYSHPRLIMAQLAKLEATLVVIFESEPELLNVAVRQFRTSYRYEVEISLPSASAPQ